jgi:3-oxoadipate enol-lactonase
MHHLAPSDDRIPIVLLHSLGTDSTLWRHQIPLLKVHGPVLTPETRGHGTSPWPGSTSMADWVEDLDRTIRPVGPVHLVGLSMGGMQAVAYANAYPDMVLSLVVANSFACLPAEVARQRVSDAATAIQDHGIDQYADIYLSQTLTRDLSADDYNTLRDAIAGMHPDAYRASADITFHGDVTPQLTGITCPTLVLTGANDVKTPLSAAEVIADGITGARLSLIEDAGHLSCIENPLAFTREVAGFIEAAITVSPLPRTGLSS